VIRRRFKRTLLAAIGDDGVGPMWQRLSTDGRIALRLASAESRDLGHPGLADEHILLGVLRHATNSAAALLHDRGITLASARAALESVGATLPARSDPTTALHAIGIDLTDVRAHLDAAFGPDAVRAAERRVRRRPRWRGGHPQPSPLCRHLLTKRAFHYAIDRADRHGEGQLEPRHLLYGAVRDALDPTGTQLSRRSLTALTTLGFTAGRASPLRLILQAHGVDPQQLTAQLAAPA
jgi:ATP-dependent Clp protease ATP-binding subunit ClpA